MKKGLITLIGLCILSIYQISYANTPIGQVIWSAGAITARQPAEAARILARHSPIYTHDMLSTSNNGTGQIAFTDNSVLSLQKDTVVKLDQYQFGGNVAPQKDAFVIAVIKGGFRTITGTISKNNPGGYQATTPVATIGVRGTMYSVYFNLKKTNMAAKLDKGSIVISNKKGDVTLKKCGAKDVGCHDKLFSIVEGVNSAPQIITFEPDVFKNEPALIPIIQSFCLAPKAKPRPCLEGSQCPGSSMPKKSAP